MMCLEIAIQRGIKWKLAAPGKKLSNVAFAAKYLRLFR